MKSKKRTDKRTIIDLTRLVKSIKVFPIWVMITTISPRGGIRKDSKQKDKTFSHELTNRNQNYLFMKLKQFKKREQLEQER